MIIVDKKVQKIKLNEYEQAIVDKQIALMTKANINVGMVMKIQDGFCFSDSNIKAVAMYSKLKDELAVLGNNNTNTIIVLED